MMSSTGLADQIARSAPLAQGRLFWLDASRTAALAAMIVFHFTYDLELFGFLSQGFTNNGIWPLFARAIAGTFIFLSGVSFVLAHGNGFRFQAWLKRFALIAAAAMVVSVATFFAFPDRFIYFGILHCIAASSILGALLLRAPAWGLIAGACLVLGVHNVAGAHVFVSPWMAWTGLSTVVRPSMDYLPLVPWLAPFLFGIASAKALPVRQLNFNIARSPLAVWISWPGRHSLSIYLIHQPILLGALALVRAII